MLIQQQCVEIQYILLIYNKKVFIENIKRLEMIKLSYQMGFIFLVNTFCY